MIINLQRSQTSSQHVHHDICPTSINTLTSGTIKSSWTRQAGPHAENAMVLQLWMLKVPARLLSAWFLFICQCKLLMSVLFSIFNEKSTQYVSELSWHGVNASHQLHVVSVFFYCLYVTEIIHNRNKWLVTLNTNRLSTLKLNVIRFSIITSFHCVKLQISVN